MRFAFRKYSTLFIAICLILSLLFITAYAETNDTDAGSDPALLIEGEEASAQLTTEEAGLALRAALKSHTAGLTLTVRPDLGFDTEAAVREIAFAQTGEADEGDYLRTSCSINALSDVGETAVVLTYSITYYITAEQETALAAKAEELAAPLKSADMDAYMLAYNLYQLLKTNTQYRISAIYDTTDTEAMTAYGALVCNSAIGEGFAQAYYRLALLLGLDCRIVSGTTVLDGQTMNHAWNVVCIGNRNFYVDAAMDTLQGSDAYFLCGANSRFIAGSTADNLLPHHASGANSLSVSTYDYSEYSPCGEHAFWIYDDGTLTITGTGAVYDYLPADEADEDNPSAPWSPLLPEVTQLIVEEGITAIGDYAFFCEENQGTDYEEDDLSELCRCLKEVTLPESLTSIGAMAFAYSGVEEICLSHITELGDGAFMNCFRLKVDPQLGNVTGIPMGAFGGCISMPAFTVPATAAFIREQAFFGCIGLEEIVIPGSVKEIGDNAFAACENLRSVELREGVQILRPNAFTCCGPERIVLPASITQVLNNCFGGCSSLKEIEFLGTRPVIGVQAFTGVTATVYYPAQRNWGTPKANYNGSLTWVCSACRNGHTYGASVLKEGIRRVTCIYCSNGYEAVNGDVNEDSLVNAADLAELVRCLDAGTLPETDTAILAADLNGDGTVNGLDAIALVYLLMEIA